MVEARWVAARLVGGRWSQKRSLMVKTGISAGFVRSLRSVRFRRLVVTHSAALGEQSVCADSVAVFLVDTPGVAPNYFCVGVFHCEPSSSSALMFDWRRMPHMCPIAYTLPVVKHCISSLELPILLLQRVSGDATLWFARF